MNSVPPRPWSCDRSGDHRALSETVFRATRKGPETKPLHPPVRQRPERRARMRSLMFGACLLAVAVVGFHSMISSALTSARDDRAAAFSERFAPALKTPSG